MTQTQMLSQLKFRIANLQSNLSQKQKLIEQYKYIETQADAKIKGMQKIHSQKIKSLLNSIQILKKQKASIQGLSKQHKRSKLIEQLNKQINDQDLVIQILRKYVYQKQDNKEDGRKICDDIIVTALKKGPQRIRPLTRQQLRMEIQQLKNIKFSLQSKLKQTGKKKIGQTRADLDQTQSIISSISQDQSSLQQQSKTQEFLNKIRSLQIQSQNLKLESNSKNKIIEKLKVSVLQGQKFKSQVQLLKNQIEISNRKLFAFEKILKENKETTNRKLIDLYQRQLKVEQLQMIGRQNSDQIKTRNQTHNILMQEIQAQKQELQAKYEQLKQQNEKIILQNISSKKHQQNQKSKIDQIRNINQRQKNDLSEKLKQNQIQIMRILEQNDKLKDDFTQISNKVFNQRAEWIEQKQKYLEELASLRQGKIGRQQATSLMIENDHLREQNQKLKSILSTGGSNQFSQGSNKLLLERLQNYKRKVQYCDNVINKGPKSKQIEIYNELFKKYNSLNQEFMEYKKHARIGSTTDIKKKLKRKEIIDMTLKQKQKYEELSSGIDELNLADVDSEILDNFDTSYQYSIHIDQNGKHVKMPKISQADKQLLKLISSDLWCFVKDDQLTKKLQEVSIDSNQSSDYQKKVYQSQKVRKLKNLSNPQGQKIKIYYQQLGQMDEMNDDVSITSAVEKQINNYDSDVNIQFAKIGKDAPSNLNYNNLKNLNLQIGSDIQVSSVESGQSSIRRKKKPQVQKASKLKFGSKQSINSSQINSQLSQDLLNSDVSSVNISQRQLNRIDSDIETDFRKKKRR